MVLTCFSGPTAITLCWCCRRGGLFFDGVNWFPVIDGDIVPHPPPYVVDQYHNALMRGDAASSDLPYLAKGVDLITGVNSDEGTLFVALGYPLVMRWSDVEQMCTMAFGSEYGSTIYDVYTTNMTWSTMEGPGTVAAAMITDLWRCGFLRFFSYLSEAFEFINEREAASQGPPWNPTTLRPSGGSVFVYEFSQQPSNLPPGFQFLGAFHGAELYYTHRRAAAAGLSNGEIALSHEISRAWGSFVHGHWPKVRLGSKLLLRVHE